MSTLQNYIKELEALSDKYAEEQTLNDLACMQGHLSEEEEKENDLLLKSLLELDKIINNVKQNKIIN